MKTGTHTLAELRDMKSFVMGSNGIVTTRFGANTINYWIECENGLWLNYDCETQY